MLIKVMQTGGVLNKTEQRNNVEKNDDADNITESLKELNLSASGLAFKLPSAPEFMCIMKCKDGKPRGLPIWKTFQHEDGLSIANETVSATFLSLSQRLTMFNPDPKQATIIKISVGDSTYSVYLPGRDDKYQFAFVVAFERTEKVKISDEDRKLLVNRIVERLKRFDELMEWKDGAINHRNEISVDHPLYQQILHAVSEELLHWDQERVKYLENKLEKERKILHKLIEKLKSDEKDV